MNYPVLYQTILLIIHRNHYCDPKDSPKNSASPQSTELTFLINSNWCECSSNFPHCWAFPYLGKSWNVTHFDISIFIRSVKLANKSERAIRTWIQCEICGGEGGGDEEGSQERPIMHLKDTVSSKSTICKQNYCLGRSSANSMKSCPMYITLWKTKCTKQFYLLTDLTI